MATGFVYILVSPNSSFIKIGGTTHPVMKRVREINGAAPYRDHGPWQLSDFLHVTDWIAVEGALHRHFRPRRVSSVETARELFAVAPHEARQILRSTDSALRIGHEKTTELFRSQDAMLYLYRLSELTGLLGSLDIQGAWVLSVLTATMGRSRWFTLSIGPHEVAFSTREPTPRHFLILDSLLRDYPDTIRWLREHAGAVGKAHYRTARERALTVEFMDEFAAAERFFRLPGVRRALVAYWFEALADLRERNAKSTYARFHNYDAVAELIAHKRATETVFSEITSGS